MDTVKVVYVGYISQVVSKRQEEITIVPGSNVRALLELLEGMYGEAFKSIVTGAFRNVDQRVRVLVDDKDIANMDGLNTKLKDGAKVSVVVLFELPAGG